MAAFRKKNGKAEVLLGLRLNNPGKGKWSFPGGGVEGKENLSTTAVREFREEVGVQLLDRYITKIGVYKIHNLLFEWETQIVETTQNINPKGVGSWWRTGEAAKNYGGEFATLEWFALEDLGKLKLHRWVREVVKVYQSNQMKPYTPKPPVKKAVLKPIPAYKALQDEFDFSYNQKTEPSGENILFDIAEMVLMKTASDGTKYYKPRYAPVSVKQTVSRTGVASAWK